MRQPRTHSTVVAAVAALAIGMSSAAMAQSPDTTKKVAPAKSAAYTTKAPAKKPAASTQRIKIKKHSAAGEVVPMKTPDTAVVAVDTTMPVMDTTTKIDTTIMKVDTTAKVVPVTTIDTTAVATTPEAPIMKRRHFGNFYAGLASGTSVPSGDIYNGYNPGLNISVPMGWQPPGGLLDSD